MQIFLVPEKTEIVFWWIVESKKVVKPIKMAKFEETRKKKKKSEVYSLASQAKNRWSSVFFNWKIIAKSSEEGATSVYIEKEVRIEGAF